ncbi:MAG: hypothetical protein IGS38_05800 [Synechococcales cyanobacterium M58_A2018_015]|nr:hypothetical protein [Synechococcales cyanobacterium M58_A2018_015]
MNTFQIVTVLVNNTASKSTPVGSTPLDHCQSTARVYCQNVTIKATEIYCGHLGNLGKQTMQTR